MADTVEQPEHCKFCGKEIENRSEPNMGGPSRDNWVHVPGGYTICYPQHAADSPRATPSGPNRIGYRADCPECRRIRGEADL